jgi:uncharacterized protein involved in exopolysaccharide biosynthesis
MQNEIEHLEINKISPRTRLYRPPPPPTIRDLIAPLFRHKSVAFSVFVGVSALALFVAWFWAARYYVSEMQVVVNQVRSDPTISSAQNASVMSNRMITPDQISSEIALIRGDDILRNVAQVCGLSNRWSASEILLPNDPERVKAARIESAAYKLSKGVKAEAEKISEVITVKYGAIGDPALPACVLKNIGKLYVEKHLLLKRPEGSSNFFAEQTERYHKQLADIENQLTQFSKNEGVAAPDLLRTNAAQQMTNSIAALHQAEQQMAADQQRLQADEVQLQDTPERITTQQSANAASLLIQNLQASLLEAQLKRSQLAVKYDPSFPLVREADEEIAKTQAAIEEAKNMNYGNQTTDLNPTHQLLLQDIAKTRLDLASQKATAAATQKSIDSMRLQMVDWDAKSVKQAELLREQKATEANYLLYLGKREQERTSDALDKNQISDVAIAVPPVPSSLPAFNPFLVSLGGIVLAFLAAIAASFVADWMDPSFRTPAEIITTLQIPVLASVPKQLA